MKEKRVPERCVDKLLGSRGRAGRGGVRPCLHRETAQMNLMTDWVLGMG